MTNPIQKLLTNYPQLTVCQKDIETAVQAICDVFAKARTLYLCGNGGSCADAEHIAGEFLKGFCKKRPIENDTAEKLRQFGEEGEMLASKLQQGLRAIPLTDFASTLSAVRNDLDGQIDYAQVLFALAKPGDALLAISTSGNSKNARLATLVAKAQGLKTIALTGAKGGKLAELADITIRVPETETYRIQELHLPIYHAICLAVEESFFKA